MSKKSTMGFMTGASPFGNAPDLLERARRTKRPIQPPSNFLHGTVVALNQEMGIGYVKESKTGILYGLSRKFIGHDAWDYLRENIEIHFEDNGSNAAKTVFISG